MLRFTIRQVFVASVLVVALSCLFPSTAFATVKYWIGASGANFSDNANWSTSSGGSNDTTKPGSGDVATFDSGGNTNCTMDAAVNVAGVDIKSTYTATITQAAGVTIAVGSTTWVQANGIFVGGDSTIDLNNGQFKLTGGTFTSTTGTMQVYGNWTHSAGGTFTHNNGTVEFADGVVGTIDVATSEEFKHVKFTKTGGADLNIAAGDTIIINGDFTSSGSSGSIVQTGAIDLYGNLYATTVGTVSTPITFKGTAAQTIDLGANTGIVNGNLIVNKSEGTVTLATDLILDAGGQDFTLTAGGVDISNKTFTVNDDFNYNGGNIKTTGGNTITFGDYFQTANVTFNSLDATVDINSAFDLRSGTFNATTKTMFVGTSWTHTAGGTFNHNNATVDFDSGFAGTFDVNASDTFYNVKFSKGGNADLTITSGDLMLILNDLTFNQSSTGSDMRTGDIEIRGNISYTGSANASATNTPILFSGSSNQTVNLAGATSLLDGNITVNKSDGTVTLNTAVDMNVGGQDFTITAGGVDIGGNTFTVNDDFNYNGGNFITTGNNTITFGDYFQTANVTFNSLDATVDINSAFDLRSGTFNATTKTMFVGTNWTHTAGGTFNHNNATVDFDGGVAGTFDVNASDTFYNVKFSKGSSTDLTITSGVTMLILNDLTFNQSSSGSDMRTGDIEIRGNISYTGSANASQTNTPILFSGSSNQSINLAGATSLLDGNITVNKSDGTVTLNTAVDMNAGGQDFTITAGGVDIGGNTFTVNDDFNYNGGNFITTGNNTITFGDYFQTANVTFSSLDATIDVNSSFNLSAGTFNASATKSLLVGTGWTHTAGGTFNHNNGTVDFDSGVSGTLDVNVSETFYNVKFSKFSSTNLTITSGDTVLVMNNFTFNQSSTGSDVDVGTIEVRGNVSYTGSANASASSAAFLFSGTNNQSLSLGAAIGAIDGNVTVNKSSGTLTVDSNLSFNGSGQTLTMQSGTFYLNGYTITNNTGGITVNNGGIFKVIGSETIVPQTGGPVFNSGGLMEYSGTSSYTIKDYSYADVTVSGSGTFSLGAGESFTNINVNAGVFHANGYNMTVSSVINNNSTMRFKGSETTSLTMDNNSGTVIYDGTGTYTSLAGITQFNNLTLSTAGTWQLNDGIDVANDLTITAGVLDANARGINVGNNWVNTGTFTHGNGTVTFDGGNQTISGTNTFYNLTKSTATPVTLNFTSGQTQIIAGALTLRGQSGNLLSVGASSSGTEASIDPQGSRVLKYLNVSDNNNINVTAAECNEGCIDGTRNTNWNFTDAGGNDSPNMPTSLGPTVLVNGSSTSEVKPTFTFSLSDPDGADTVKYQIQIDDNNDFISPYIDYTSTLGAQGAKTFTVGQSSGGTYTTGSADSVIAYGNNYWRVKAIDNSSASSEYVQANSGGIAFIESTLVVNKTADTNDGTCNADCSFREAITKSNSLSGANTIKFGISGCAGACLLQPTSELPALSDGSLTIDGYSQSGATVGTLNFPSAINAVLKIILDGSNAGAGSDGLEITSASNIITGLNIRKFNSDGIEIVGANADSNKIQGCFIGTNETGEVDNGSAGAGIYVQSSADSNVIGVDGDGVNEASERNVISGNDGRGIRCDSGPCTVAGNFIGTDDDGTLDLGNTLDGFYTNGGGAHYVGTDGDGVSDSIEGNLISGNNSNGVYTYVGATNTVVAGNYIGTDLTGKLDLGNTSHGVSLGVVSRVGTNADGVSDTYERNIISGNNQAGIRSDAGSNTIKGNYIGLGSDGTTSLGNTQDGVIFYAGNGNILGTDGDGSNDSIEGNYISCNGQSGVELRTGPNTVAGNKIGININSSACANAANGVQGTGLTSVDTNTIGGDLAVEGNTIAYNTGDGINFTDANHDGNLFYRNSIYENTDKGIDLNNVGNNNKQPPTISSHVVLSGSSLTVSGSSSASDTVQLFDADSSNAEGQTFITSVSADGSGNWSATVSSPYTATNNVIVATCSDATGTSPFSSGYTITNSAPLAPTALGPTNYTDQSNVTGTKPSLTFNLDDPNNDQVKYQIQIDNNSDYSSPYIDYTSALQTEGAASFTVGQAAGAGTYTTGNADTVLQYGVNYWQVKAIDSEAAGSAYTVANAGTAFVQRTYTVNVSADTTDGLCDATSCTLREALVAATADAYTPRNIEFWIPSSDGGCDGGGVCTIQPSSALNNIPASTTINGYTQSGALYNVQLFPNPLNSVIKIQLDGSNAGAVAGLTTSAASTVVKGLSIIKFGTYGWVVNGAVSSNKLQGCYVGVTASGDGTLANGSGGISISSSSTANYVGTDSDGVNDVNESNLISGNTGNGITVAGGSNTIAGNFIGTDKDGDTKLINTLAGVSVSGANNIIGVKDDVTNDTYEGNLVSGNGGNGIVIGGTGNTIAGNMIGLNAAGTGALGNSSIGINVSGRSNIFGTDGDGVSDTLERNFIAGNASYGVYSTSTGSLNRFAGNYVGTNKTGTAAVGNTIGFFMAGTSETIGTNSDGNGDASEGNVISGNATGPGIQLNNGDSHIVAGNIIGLNAAGTGKVANATYGILIGRMNNRVGTNGDGVADTQERNTISGNGSIGIGFTSANATGNTVSGNYIGVGTDGVTDFGNGSHGISFVTTANSNTIGGDIAAEANIIAFNGDATSEYGIYATGSDVDVNRFLRNKMYSNQDLGIFLGTGSNNDQASPVIASELVSGNDLNVSGTGTADNTIQLFDASVDGEGETYLGQATADGSGNWTITISSPYNAAGNKLTATCDTTANGTSKFSATYEVVGATSIRNKIIIVN